MSGTAFAISELQRHGQQLLKEEFPPRTIPTSSIPIIHLRYCQETWRAIRRDCGTNWRWIGSKIIWAWFHYGRSRKAGLKPLQPHPTHPIFSRALLILYNRHLSTLLASLIKPWINIFVAIGSLLSTVCSMFTCLWPIMNLLHGMNGSRSWKLLPTCRNERENGSLVLEIK